MKAFIVILILLLSSCSEFVNTRNRIQENKHERYELIKNGKQVNGFSISVMEYDSCEYLIISTEFNQNITHKGNCKHCKSKK